MPSRGDEVTRTRRTGYERDEQNAERTHARTLCARLSLLALVAAAAREPREPGLALRSLRPGEALLAGVAVASGRADVSGAPGSARVARHARETCTTHTHTQHTPSTSGHRVATKVRIAPALAIPAASESRLCANQILYSFFSLCFPLFSRWFRAVD